eukprot:gnl/Trimastix_PCT/2062.p1 GENE.gnl/Trimastix_PCT/2062~~gnl/Trimastix_PCT/2062.p1  ORF type:complete len:857 (+),score=356.29 gnl/Trimastix_PCT/2062:188-2758(+)
MMTTGRDVSALIHDVIRNMQTQDLEMKKLVSLYLITYSKTDPDMVLHAVNTFLKDTKSPNPLIRALAIRTMASIRVESLAEYLCEPLLRGLRDPDPYVKKTAVLGVAKLFDLNREMVLDEGFVDHLRGLLSDSNPMVVSNAVATLREIHEAVPEAGVFEVTPADLDRMLVAINTCNEWGQVFILDALATYTPPDSETADRVIERVLPRLNHANSAVVISSVKILMLYMERLDNPDHRAAICRKMAPPLVTQLSASPEIRYVALRNINLIIQKYPTVLQGDIKVFFCKYNDPLYVKMEKLEIMMLLVHDSNINSVLSELKEYASEVDVDFVRKAVRAIARCAIKLESAADLCVDGLVSLIEKSQVNYVIQEAIVVIKDIFRKYPNRYERIIAPLCEKLENLDEPEAKAAMIWIIGEYSDRIEQADEVLTTFVETFHDEPPMVQLQTLTAVVKLYLKVPQNTQQLVHRVLKMATQESDNPDLRDRGFVYWRLLSASIQAARDVVLVEKPPISSETTTLARQLIDELVPHMATLASVFHKPPSAFVSSSKLAVPRGQQLSLNPDDDEPAPVPEAAPPADAAPAPSGGDLIPDLLGNLGAQPVAAPVPAATPAAPPTDLLAGLSMGAPATPSAPVLLSAADGKGLQITGDFVCENGTIFIDATFTNQSTEPMADFEMQFNRNSFGVCPAGALDLPSPMMPGQSCPTRLPCTLIASHLSEGEFNPEVQIAIRCTAGLSFFTHKMSILCTAQHGASLERQEFLAKWQQIPDTAEQSLEITGVHGLDPTVNRLQGAGLFEIARRRPPDSPDVVVLYFYGRTQVRESEVFLELTLRPSSGKISLRSTRPETVQHLLRDIAAVLV